MLEISSSSLQLIKLKLKLKILFGIRPANIKTQYQVNPYYLKFHIKISNNTKLGVKKKLSSFLPHGQPSKEFHLR